MATNYGDTVNAFYLAYYGRPADPAGLAFWTQALQKSNGDVGAIASAFASSPEATARFGSESVADRVTEIYQQLFNRAPDKAGLAYWVDTIQAGKLSMADAALQITQSAQNTDAQISTARAELAAQFTAAVAASNIAYDGYAAIQAAHVLLSAVSANSQPSDIKALVSAGTSLVQTAHDNPAIITALANGGDLSSVLSTASGHADPVGMVQALATLGKAGLTDSSGLTALLQGGGVAGLLNSLPAGTSLHDVASAVQLSGLSVGSAVAHPPPAPPAPSVPPADTTPPAALKLQLATDSGVSATDHITNDGHVQVSGIEAGASWEYSLNGTTWTTGPAANANGAAVLATTGDGDKALEVRSHDAAGNVSAITTLQYTLKTSYTVTEAFHGPDGKALPLDAALPVNSPYYFVYIDGAKAAVSNIFQVSDTGADGSWVTTSDEDQLADGLHYIRYVFTDAAGNVANANPLKLMVDTVKPAAPTVALVNDTGTSATDHITSDGHIKVSGIEAGAAWDYSINGTTWTTGPAADANGAALLATTGDGDKALQVRSHDAAGNVSDAVTLQYTLATSYTVTEAFKGPYGYALPAEATLSVNSPNYVVYTYGAKAAVSTSFQVSDTGADGSWVTTSDQAQLTDGLHYIRYVFTDAAGNVAPANPLKLMVDTVAPATPTVALADDTGVSSSDGITKISWFKVSGIETGGGWEYSTDGTTWRPGSPADADGIASGFLAPGEQTLQIRTHDAAGNVSPTTSLHATFDDSVPADGLAFNHLSGEAPGVTTTAQAKVDAVFSYTGTIDSGDTVEYTFDGNVWIKADSSMIDAAAKTITVHDIDLSVADRWVEIHASAPAGYDTYAWQSIDGPYTNFLLQPMSDAGFSLFSYQTAHIYLTDAGHSVQIHSTDASGDAVHDQTVTVGIQPTAVQGVLGAGQSPTVHTDIASTFGLGTTGNDTLTGQYVWGYDGDDTITAGGTVEYNSSIIYGGAGADTIHTETSSSQIMFANAQESMLVADDKAAHGFDTVYISNDTSTKFTEALNFEDVKFGDGNYRLTGNAYTGTETGNALLALLNTTVAGSFKTGVGVQSAIIDFGTPGSPGDVNFLVVDTDGDGRIGVGDYVVKIVGAVDPLAGTGTNWSIDYGMVTIHNSVT